MSNYQVLPDEFSKISKLMEENKDVSEEVELGINKSGELIAKLCLMEPLDEATAKICINQNIDPKDLRNKIHVVRFICAMNDCPNFTSLVCMKCNKKRCQYHIVDKICYECRMNESCCVLI